LKPMSKWQESIIKSVCIVYNYIRKTQVTKVKRREEEILEQEQQRITVSVEHCLFWTSFHWSTTGMRQVKRLLCVAPWKVKRSSNITCATLASRRGCFYLLCTYLTNFLNSKHWQFSYECNLTVMNLQ
jgi:hypothetical protein